MSMSLLIPLRRMKAPRLRGSATAASGIAHTQPPARRAAVASQMPKMLQPARRKNRDARTTFFQWEN